MTRLLQHVVSAPSKEREEEIAALGPWFHNVHLPDGSLTAPAHPLGDFPAFKWRVIAPVLPEDLTGWRALDIGCNAGFYTVELARRGAHVTGIDVEPLFLRQAEWVASEFGITERVEFRRMQLYDLARLDEQFDLVIFMGVFYHLRYPLLGLDIVAEKVRRLMVFQTMMMPGDDATPDARRDRSMHDRHVFLDAGWPKMAFIEHDIEGDPTNWWVPNASAVQAMLRSSGLGVIARPEREILVCEPLPGTDVWPRTRGAAELLAATGRPWAHRAPA